MSNRSPLKTRRPLPWALVLWLSAPLAFAQSPTLLQAVKLHRPGAEELAASETEACRQARCPDLARLNLLLGYLQLSEGHAASARTTLRAAAPPAGLEAFHAYYLGQAHFYAGSPTEAAKVFTAAVGSAPASLVLRLQARTGEALIAAHRPAEALPFLEAATQKLGRPELYWARAAARAAAGDDKGRGEDLRRVAVSFPDHPYGQAALALLEAEEPRPLSFEQRLTRAAQLLDGSAQAALDELAVIQKQKLARTRVMQARAALIGTRAHFSLGDPVLGERQLKLAAKGPPEIAAEATYAKARHLLRIHDNAAARTVMAQIDRRWPNTNAAREAGFYAAWLDFQGGNLQRAVQSFAAYEKKYPRGRRRDDSMWFRALSQLLLGQHLPARTTLQELAQQFPSSLLVPQALYWSARAQQLSGPGQDSTGEYQRLLAAFPASFYGVLASQRLRELGLPPVVAFPSPPSLPAPKVPAALDLSVALLRAGLHMDATLEIGTQTSRVRGTAAALEYGQALSSLGEFGAAFGIATRSLWGKAYTEKNGEALALMYPRPFSSVVTPESEAAGIDPYLTWAIMRRESTFRPELISSADARGLMQIIPPTANGIAAQREEPAPEPDALFSPALNVRYGAWYLGRLMERFGHPALAAAAYNAGPPASARWAQEHGQHPLDLLVELVSYRETRAYIKQVVADLLVYRALYETGGVLPPLSLEVPTPSADGVKF